MKLIKFEQSGFILETTNGYKLAIDIGSYTPVEKLEDTTVDAMLVSHIHGDHFSIEQIKKLAPKKLYLNEECIEALGEEKLSSEIINKKISNIIPMHYEKTPKTKEEFINLAKGKIPVEA
ncbi:MAG: MBL fold metallo-hydrolase [bacterium]|nr:MBL fold metallo-hydrolase [bacterium]